MAEHKATDKEVKEQNECAGLVQMLKSSFDEVFADGQAKAKQRSAERKGSSPRVMAD